MEGRRPLWSTSVGLERAPSHPRERNCETMTQPNVEVTVEPGDEPDETPSAAEEHSEEVVVDAAIGAGVASAQAADSAGEAQVSEINAEHAAREANDVAAVQQQQIDQLRAVTDELRAAIGTLAGAAATVAQATAEQNESNAGVLDDPGESITIEEPPASTHFLSRRLWGGSK